MRGNAEADAQGAFAFLFRHTHWGHYLGVISIVMSLSMFVITLGWFKAGLIALGVTPIALYGLFRWIRAYRRYSAELRAG